MSRDNIWYEMAHCLLPKSVWLMRTVADAITANAGFLGGIGETVPVDGTSTGCRTGGLFFEKSTGQLYKNAGSMSSCRFIPFEGGSGGTAYDHVGLYAIDPPAHIANARPRITRDCTIVGASAAWKSAYNLGQTIIDILYSRDKCLSWTSIFSTKLTIDLGERTSDTAATPCVLSTTALLAGDYIRINPEQGNGSYLTVQMEVTYP